MGHVNRKTFSINLKEALINVATGLVEVDYNVAVNPQSLISSIVSNAIKGISAGISYELEYSDAACTLLFTSCMEAIKDVLNCYKTNFGSPKKSMLKEIQSDFKKELNSNDEIENALLNNDLFDDFNSTAIVQAVASVFKNWLRCFDQTETIYESAKNYFVIRFQKNTEKEYIKNLKMYGNLRSSPFAESNKINQTWMDYWLKIRNLFFQNLVYDDFSLNDIYIELFGFYLHRKNANSLRTCRIIKSETWLMDWINCIDEHNIMLISGKPGSGKTTLLKKVANNLATNYSKVIWIPLKHFVYGDNIWEGINEFAEYELGYKQILNDFFQSKEKLVILFDGLDEIALCGEDSLIKAKKFILLLKKQLNNIEHSNIKIIISGRELVISELKNFFVHQNQEYILRLLPMYLSEDHSEKYENFELIEDLRNKWWYKYGVIRNVDYSQGIPQEIIDNCSGNLDEITGDPLLSYLLALCYENKTILFNNNIEINELYFYFIEKIYNEIWKDGFQNSILEIVDKEMFIRFFEKVAICTISSEYGVANINEIIRNCQDDPYLINVLNNLTDSGVLENGVCSLMLAFYIDKNTEMIEKSFEFSHKSFGEYLASRYLVHEAINILLQAVNSHQSKDVTSNSLYRLFNGQELDYYLTPYILSELNIWARDNMDSIIQIQTMLSEIFIYAIEYKHNDVIISDNKVQDLLTHQRNYEESLYSLLIMCGSISEVYISLEHTNQHSFVEWINNSRLFIVEEFEIHNCHRFYYIIMVHAFMRNINFYGYYMDHVKLHYCGLQYANLGRTDIIDSEFKNCEFDYTSIFQAKISNTTFIGSKFHGTAFNCITFIDIIFDNCIFYNTVFINCEFKNCKFINITKSKNSYILFSKDEVNNELNKYETAPKLIAISNELEL